MREGNYFRFQTQIIDFTMLWFSKQCTVSHGVNSVQYHSFAPLFVLHSIMYNKSIFAANKSRVYYGLLKEPDINIQLDDEEDGGEAGEDKPNVHKV